jgi:hypothetical protein
MYVCMYVCVRASGGPYICTYIHTHTHTYIQHLWVCACCWPHIYQIPKGVFALVHVCVYVCICTCVCVNTCMHIFIYYNVCMQSLCVCAYMYVFFEALMYIERAVACILITRMHTYMHTCTHTHTLLYAHLHTLSS